MRKVLLTPALILLSSLVIAQITEPQATVVNMDSIEPLLFGDVTVRAVVANTVRVMRLELAEGTTSPHHNHADEEIFLLLEGRLRVIGGDNTFMMSPGDVFVVPPFVPHQLEALVDSVVMEAGGPGPLLDLFRPQTQ